MGATRQPVMPIPGTPAVHTAQDSELIPRRTCSARRARRVSPMARQPAVPVALVARSETVGQIMSWSRFPVAAGTCWLLWWLMLGRSLLRI